MIGQAINRSWQQLLDPRFRSVFFTALAAALTTLAALNYALYAYWPENWETGIDWLDQSGFVALSVMGSYILFPGLVTMVMGFLSDRIADAVEDEYYPNHKGLRKVSLGEVLFGALKLTVLIILINLLALVPYLLLLFTGIGTIILFIAVNGFLLGREYFEMVALRHMDAREVARMRRLYGGRIFVGGALISALFLVPFLNLLAPIVGAAMMTHVFHFLAHEDGRVFNR